MVDRDGNNLVFLLCTPRSGSSLAAAMLHNHSRMFAAQEMWFLMSLHDLRAPVPRAYGGAGILRQFYNGVLPDDAFMEACRSFALQVYNGLLRSSGGTAALAIDKSPRYYGVLEFVDALFPQAQRIWLIRNPLAVLASHKKVSLHRGASFDTEAVLRGDALDMRAADLTVGLFRYFHYFADRGSDDPHAYRLHYEQLVADPAAQLAEVSRFLGLAYETGMENYRSAEARDSAKSELYFSMGVGDPFVAEHTKPHQDSVDAWKEILHKREVEMYVRLLGARIFRDLGYSEQLAEAERWTGVRFEAEPDASWLDIRSGQLTGAAGFRWEPNYRMKTPSAGREGERISREEGVGEAAAAWKAGVPIGKTAVNEATDAVGDKILADEATGATGGKSMANEMTDAIGGKIPADETTVATDGKSTASEATGASSEHSPGAQLLQMQMIVRTLENRLENSVRERRRLQDQLQATRRKVNGLKSMLPFGERLSRLVSSYLAKDGGKR